MTRSALCRTTSETLLLHSGERILTFPAAFGKSHPVETLGTARHFKHSDLLAKQAGPSGPMNKHNPPFEAEKQRLLSGDLRGAAIFFCATCLPVGPGSAVGLAAAGVRDFNAGAPVFVSRSDPRRHSPQRHGPLPEHAAARPVWTAVAELQSATCAPQIRQFAVVKVSRRISCRRRRFRREPDWPRGGAVRGSHPPAWSTTRRAGE